MKPNPHDMLIFLDVVEMRSFTAAAKSTGLTKSAVSQAVKRLEDDMREKLLFRSTRSLSLTEAGSRLISHCKALKQIHENTRVEFLKENNNFQETLTITTPHALCRSIIIPTLTDLRNELPDLSIRLITDDAPVNLVERRIDIAVRIGSHGPQSAYISRVGMLHEHLYASKTYVDFKGGIPSDFLDLVQWTHIANEWQGSSVKYTIEPNKTITVQPTIRCNNINDVMAIVGDSCGIAMLPELAVNTFDKRDQLVQLCTVNQTPIFAMHQYRMQVPRRVKTFVRYLRKKLKEN
ncbi:MAG: LysR family transcriptional regulator [Hyphomicrobiales bacterium]